MGLRIIVFLCFASGALGADFGDQLRPFVQQYCVDCHGPEKQKGDLRLDDAPTEIKKFKEVDLWQLVLKQLNASKMPPEKKKQPTSQELTEVLEAITYNLDDARNKLDGQKQEFVMRRLNRREYLNTIHDLTGILLEESEVPPDAKLTHFDTNGKSLFMSAFMFDRYRDLGRQALDKAIQTGDRPKVLRVAGTKANVRNNWFRRGIEENKNLLKDMPDLNLHQRARWKANIRGLENYLSYAQAKDYVLVSELFTAGHPWQDKIRNAGSWIIHPSPHHRKPPWPVFEPGYYKIKVVAGAGDHEPGDVVELNVGCQSVDPIHKKFVISAHYAEPQSVEATYYLEKPETFQVSTTISRSKGKHIPFVAIKSIDFEGPIHTQWPPASHTKIFPKPQGAMPAGEYAEEIIKSFSLQAFRGRTPTKEFTSTLLDLFSANRERGMTLHDAIKDPLAIILSSPKFIYMLEEKGESLTGLELANRLSYFLWSSYPDPELYDLARSGELEKPEVMRKQVGRMLKDEKAMAFSKGFVPQWLELHRLAEISINHRFKGAYNQHVEQDVKMEPVHFFHTIAIRNLSVANFIDSDFLVINHVMKKFYGLPTNSHDAFELTKLPRDSARGGILGQAAVLVITGNGERTSPVKRGNFVNSKILGMNSPSPPADVPELPEKKGVEAKSMREILKMHTSRPQCSSCHTRMDPSGYGLENFNAVGLWRDHPEGSKGEIDNDGRVYEGAAYTNLFEFKKALMGKKNDFTESLIENILEYALGREITFADEKLVNALLAQSKANGYKFGDLLANIAASPAFRQK